MDYNLKNGLHAHIAEYLPKSVEAMPDGYTKIFMDSVRFIESKNFFLVRCLKDTENIDIIVKNPIFLVATPGYHHEISTEGLLKQVPIELFNGERKQTENFNLCVYATRKSQMKACFSGNNTLKSKGDGTYTFGDFGNTMDGNTVCVINNVINSHLYYVPTALLATRIFSVGDLCFSQAEDANFIKDLPAVIPFLRREAAFDIECVILDDNMGAETNCEFFLKKYFQDYNSMFQKYETLKLQGIQLDAPPADHIVMKRHRITSISLVLGNYHLKKSPDGHRKKFFVYYDASFPETPLDKESYRAKAMDLNIELDRIEMIGLPNEYEMLKMFMKELVNSVDTLYVYHANFDITVLKQRIAYYSNVHTNGNCCQWHTENKKGCLDELWENFLSKQPELYKGKLTLGAETLRASYLKITEDCFSMLRSLTLTPEVRQQTVKTYRAKYQEGKSKIQNLKMEGYGTEIIDLHLVANQSLFDDCKNGKLDNKAHFIISMFKPKKAEVKKRKLGDVSYDKLDAYYKAGGVQLTECLVYNLIDSHLLMRIARCLNPLEAYMFRQITTLNTDQLVHTRGTMQFNSFVGTMKCVEMSKLKARLDLKLVLSTGPLKNSLCTPETIPRRGGYVKAPLTGLSLSTPKKPFECIVDFSSLYPSIMSDLNISSETIVDNDKLECVSDYVCYDWSKIEGGFDKLTLVLKLVRSSDGGVSVVRHSSDMGVSLQRYLNQRKIHRAELKKAVNELDKTHHNKLQNEMKICANSHYGAAPQTCALMIATQGQHKSKRVNKHLADTNTLTIYGDTDSSFCWARPLDEDFTMDGFDVDNMTEYILKKLSGRILDYVRRRVQNTQVFIDNFLQDISVILLDDVMEKMVLIVDGQRATPFQEGTEWYVIDPRTHLKLNITEPFRKNMLNNLEYESCSSITCHMAKKMVRSEEHNV